MKKTIKRRHLKSPDGVVTCTIFRSPQTSRRLECEKSIKTKLENVQNGLTCALQFAQILTTTSLYSDYFSTTKNLAMVMVVVVMVVVVMAREVNRFDTNIVLVLC